MELWCARGHQKWSQFALSIGTSGFLPKRCCGDHFMVKNSCQSGLILLQENHHACYDHRGGDFPATLLFYGMVSYQQTLGSPYHRFSIAQEQQSSYVACPWTEEESHKGFLAGCSGKPSKARKLIWEHISLNGRKIQQDTSRESTKWENLYLRWGAWWGNDSRFISCWHLPGPFPPSLSWWFTLQPKAWERFFGLERTQRVLCCLGAPKSIFLSVKKKELFLLILNKRRKNTCLLLSSPPLPNLPSLS